MSESEHRLPPSPHPTNQTLLKTNLKTKNRRRRDGGKDAQKGNSFLTIEVGKTCFFPGWQSGWLCNL
jgi:hypothetical protein